MANSERMGRGIIQKTGLPVYRDNRLIRYIKAHFDKWGMSFLWKILVTRKNLGLRFIMNAQDIKVCDINKFTIPVIIDFWLKEEQLPAFLCGLQRSSNLILLTNLRRYMNFCKQA